jgi:uncharacterized membrane protein
MTAVGAPRPVAHQRRAWLVPPALILLSAIPLAAGTLRVIQLTGGPAILPADHRFGFAVPVVVHFVASAVFALVAAFQFVPHLRRRHLAWHRRAGRVLVVTGLLVAGSALWMTLLYSYKPGTGDLLFGVRLLVASGMVVCLVLGVAAVRRRNIADHRAWMIRGYALAVGAGTQAVLTEPLGAALWGTGVVAGDVAKGAAWAVNLAVAEWVIRRPAILGRRRQDTRRTATSPALAPAAPTGTAP